jgi:hypothetical protein
MLSSIFENRFKKDARLREFMGKWKGNALLQAI